MMGRKYPLENLAAANKQDVEQAREILTLYTDKLYLRG